MRAFYRDLAPAPVARVVLGELVCSKRLPFWQGEVPGAVDRLVAAGKEVAMTSLALITLKRERKLTAELQDLDLPVEVNDVTALAHVPEGRPFWVGPLVNVYNEGTMRWLIRRGALEADRFVPEDKIRAITRCLNEHPGEKFALIQENLGSDYSYSEIRFVHSALERGE